MPLLLALAFLCASTFPRCSGIDIVVKNEVAENAQRVEAAEIVALRAWLKDGGGWIDERLQVRQAPRGGRGVFVTAPMMKGEVAVWLPEALALTAADIEPENDEDVKEDMLEDKQLHEQLQQLGDHMADHVINTAALAAETREFLQNAIEEAVDEALQY
eukprot:gnl/TRDRNA2_/TRDRNA2_82099_c0_seq2.p1 gnl/TRDRNA2_/TRDRNA2_82099_c0~~gnl/TRDRNA2_/TRDRNA2_82099_c0_seq2.p1  ORF type:complete len:159 (-),score=44.56 gnl/TRDRNA2_/TRDRNA2_82099_c0_seq2:9-485(-)